MFQRSNNLSSESDGVITLDSVITLVPVVIDCIQIIEIPCVVIRIAVLKYNLIS